MTATTLTSERELAARRGRWLALVVVLSAVFTQLLDTTIVTVAIPSIQSDLGTGFGMVQLVLAGYSLTFACTLITGGRLGDSYGRCLFMIGMLGFVLTSAACGLAPNGTAVVIARLVQGMSSGLMSPQVLAISQGIFDEQSRARALGAHGASIGLATISGPVLGRALIAADVFDSDWRSSFPRYLPIGILALQAGFDYSAVHAGSVTLGIANFVAVASARSSAVVRRLGTRTLSLGTGLLPSLAVAGAGAGLFLVPVTGVITAGFTRCVTDRAHATGPSATRASCAAMTAQAAKAPEAVRKTVEPEILQTAMSQARRHDFSRTLRQALTRQLGVFALSFLLVLALPRVRGTDVATVPGA